MGAKEGKAPDFETEFFGKGRKQVESLLFLQEASEPGSWDNGGWCWD